MLEATIRAVCAVTGASTVGGLSHPATVASAVRLSRRGAVGKDGVRIKAHRLTFRLDLLEPVLSGSKGCTVRFSKVAARVQCGDGLTLAFGAYHRPVIVAAAAARVETINLEPEIKRAYTLPESVMSLVAERRFYEQPIRPDATTPAALVEALAASGGDYEAVLGEAVGRGAESCTAVWFTGARRVK